MMSSSLTKQLAKITKIPHLPAIFKSVLENENEEFLLEGEVLLDTLFVERDGYDLVDNHLRKFDSWTPAMLIVVTNYGLSVLREGGLKVLDSLYGYSIHHTVFNKVSSLELDICLLEGTLTLSTSTSGHPDTVIKFNSGLYFQGFERLARIIRAQVFQASHPGK
jgi:hypothetical protein